MDDSVISIFAGQFSYNLLLQYVGVIGSVICVRRKTAMAEIIHEVKNLIEIIELRVWTFRNYNYTNCRNTNVVFFTMIIFLIYLICFSDILLCFIFHIFGILHVRLEHVYFKFLRVC